MKKIVFATSNSHKIAEVSRINSSIDFISLTELKMLEDIPETGHTFRENAYQKAWYVFSRCKLPTLAEDSGLAIRSLDGNPGVLSARFAGEDKNHQNNMEKVLRLLTDQNDRSAQFISTLCFIDSAGCPHYFEGFCNGQIHTSAQGIGGFGYDPIFIPEGYERTFGELSDDIKDAISHRKKSFALFTTYINEHF